MIVDLQTALARLEGKRKRVMILRPRGLGFHRNGLAVGGLGVDFVNGRAVRQHKFKSRRRCQGAGRSAVVVHGKHLDRLQGAALGLQTHHVGRALDALQRRNGVIDAQIDAAGSRRNHFEIVDAAALGTHQPRPTRCRSLDRKLPLCVGLGGGHLGHAAHGIDQGDGDSRGGLAGGAIGHRAGDGVAQGSSSQGKNEDQREDETSPAHQAVTPLRLPLSCSSSSISASRLAASCSIESRMET